MKRVSRFFLTVILACGTAFLCVGCKTAETPPNLPVKPAQPETFTAKKLANESDYQKVFYVSYFGDDNNSGAYDKPFKTLDKARDEVRKINSDMTADIAVVVREGTTYQPSKLLLEEADGGTNGRDVIYMAYPGEEARVSGGYELTGWKRGEGGIWYLDGLKANSLRDLYVDGVRATLAREPNGNAYHEITRWDQAAEKITVNLADLKGADKNFETSLYMEWAQPVLKTKSVTKNGDKAVLSFAEWEGWFLFHRGYHEYQISNSLKVVFQNAREFLDAPGEFYYSKGESRLYYMPRANEDLRVSRVAIPNTNSIIEIAGSGRTDRAEHIVIEGLTFENTGWFGFEKYGYMEDQANHFGVSRLDAKYMAYDALPGAIQIENAEHISVRNCRFTNLGACGVNFYSATAFGEVVGCGFTDIGATAVMVGPHITGVIQDQNLYNPTDPNVTVHDISIRNNYVAWTGMNFHRSCGITNVLGYNVTIANNEVAFANNIGISNGWGWTTDETVVKNNTIENNDVHHIGMNGSDTGGIYTLTYQPGSAIRGNYIHEINIGFNGHSGNTSPAFALYIDEGSNRLTIHDNQMAYARENVQFIYYHTVGTEFDVAGNKGLLTGDALDAAIVSAAGVEEEYASALGYAGDGKYRGAAEYFLAGLWTNENPDGNYGYRMEVKRDTVVYGLGRMKISGNTDSHTLRIYGEDKSLVAECEVNMKFGKADRGGYVNAEFSSPVTLKAGKKYYVVSSEKQGSDLYFDANSYLYTHPAFQVLGIVKGDAFTTIKNFNSCYVGINLLID